MRQRAKIIQFARWPVKGNVKTRLAKDVGEQAALDCHIQLLRNVLMVLIQSQSADIELCFDQVGDDFDGMEELKALCETHSVQWTVQSAGDLGEKMYSAISSGLNDYDKAIIVGSDWPCVNDDYINKALKSLDKSDLSIVPAEDGGYVLIGARKVSHGLLYAVDWGTSLALSQTQDNAKNCGLSVSLLNLSWDVDDIHDYERWLKLVR